MGFGCIKCQRQGRQRHRRKSRSEFSSLLEWHLVIMQTDGLISSILTCFFSFFCNFIFFQMHTPATLSLHVTRDWQSPVACHLLAMFGTKARFPSRHLSCWGRHRLRILTLKSHRQPLSPSLQVQHRTCVTCSSVCWSKTPVLRCIFVFLTLDKWV